MSRRISFWATKKTQIPKKVCFKTANGKRVCFKAQKIIKKPVKVSFWAKKRIR